MGHIGAYRLLDEIGSGGMGTVYRATAPDGAAVALKVIHPHLVGKPGFRARFEREVEVGRRIRDPHVVATLGAGEIEAPADGKRTLYLAMELVEGQTLRDLLAELGSVPEDLCLHIGREVAQALVAIHGADVLHRDIKPENVLITPDSHVKVMDLGVALLADESLRLSQTGTFVGSVLYAAPEQFSELPPDGRADLYNVGLLLYELATGKHPFRADDLTTVIQKQTAARPRPPAELKPQLSPLFEEVVLNLMEKDRQQRLPTATALLDVLEKKERSDWWRQRARALRDSVAGPLRRIRIPREAPLQGRDEDLATLRGLYDRAREGEGRVVIVEGEAGIGKSRLVDEFTERLAAAGERFHLLTGSYPPGGAATAAGAFSTAYREYFGSEGLHDRLESCLRTAPGLAPAFAALLLGAPPHPPTSPLSRDALLHAFTLTTESIARDQPTVVVIEDLHFAPELGRAIFASLAASLSRHKVLLIGTTRPGPPDAWLAEIERLEHASRLSPARLTPKELNALLIELFRSERLAEQLGWAIATKSDGNPFFVFELVRALREEHLIGREPDGTWVQTGLIRDLVVPSSVLDLVEARIRDLDEVDRDLLEIASCCGFAFDPLLVARALDLAQIPAMKRLAHLEKKHRLVRALGRRYEFDHHQVQEALYRGMPDLLREPYHAKLGEALEARGPIAGADAVDVCDHFLKGGVGERAKPYLAEALAHLGGGYLHDESIALAQRALAGEGLYTGTERVELLLQVAAALELRGRHAEGRAILDEALVLADGSGDAALRSAVRSYLGRLALWTADYDAAYDWFVTARDLAEEAGDERAQRQAVGNLGIVYYRERRFDEANAIFERIRDEARQRGDKRALAVATSNLGNVHWCRGEFEAARQDYEDYRALSREIGYRGGEALAAGNLGNVLFALGELKAAQESFAEVLRLSAETGDRPKEALFAGTMGRLDVQLGRHARALRQFRRSHDLSVEVGMRREIASALWGMAHVAQERDDPAGATEQLEDALGIFEELSELESAASVHGSLAEIAVAQGREADAVRHLDLALERTRSVDHLAQDVELLAARACLPRGDVEAAVARFEAMRGRLSAATEMSAAWALYRATGGDEWLSLAKETLERMRAAAPAEDRDTMIENNRIQRAIWNAP